MVVLSAVLSLVGLLLFDSAFTLLCVSESGLFTSAMGALVGLLIFYLSLVAWLMFLRDYMKFRKEIRKPKEGAG